MKLIVNGAEREVAATTLAEALKELDYADAIVATARNGRFVPVSDRSSTKLAPHDKIEIIAPMQGG